MTQKELIDAAVARTGSQAQLAAILGYSQSYVGQLRSGRIKMRPTVESALRGIIEAPVPSLSGETSELFRNYTQTALEQFIKFGSDTLATQREYEKLNRSRFDTIVTCAFINLALTILVAGLIIYGMK